MQCTSLSKCSSLHAYKMFKHEKLYSVQTFYFGGSPITQVGKNSMSQTIGIYLSGGRKPWRNRKQNG